MSPHEYRIARDAARVRAGSPGASAQGHGDDVVRTALVNGRVLTGSGLESGRTVLLSGARIEALAAPEDSRCAESLVVDLGGQILLPGFIDVQVNGGGGVLFN